MRGLVGEVVMKRALVFQSEALASAPLKIRLVSELTGGGQGRVIDD